MQQTGTNRLAVVAVLAAACCWGALGVSYRLILDHVDVAPVTLVTIRATAAAALLAAYLQFARRPIAWRALRDVRPLFAIAAMGVVSTASFYVVLIYAYREAGVQVATVLLYLAPSFVAAGAWVFFRARLGALQIVALTVALCGVTGVSGVLWQSGGASLLGVVLGVASAVGYASYSLIGQVALRWLRPVDLVAMSLLAGLPLLWGAKFVIDGSGLPPATWIVVIALVTGVGTTIVPLTLFTWGMSRIGPSRASSLALGEPVVAVTLAGIVLGERLVLTQIAGAAAICVSLVLVARDRR